MPLPATGRACAAAAAGLANPATMRATVVPVGHARRRGTGPREDRVLCYRVLCYRVLCSGLIHCSLQSWLK